MRALLSLVGRAFLSNSLIQRYRTSEKFRVNVSLLMSLVFNFAYLLFNFISGIVYRIPSLIAVALYYTLLLSIRYTILNQNNTGAERTAQIAACRKGGILLLIVDALITLIIFYSALSAEPKQYSGFVLVVLGAHALYSIVRGIFGIYASKRDGIPIHRAAYSVRLAAASISLFNLISALLTTFISDAGIAELLVTLCGVLVSLTVLFLAFSMIFSFSDNQRSV